MLGPGQVAIDVGASIGTWTLKAASTGAFVHACEPDRINFETLQANVGANAMGNLVTAHLMALGEHQGRVGLVSTTRRYGNRVETSPAAPDSEIPMTSLDQFADDLKIDEIDVLKVNTAGGEVPVILGALGLFHSGRIKLAMVLDGLEVRPVLDELRAHSYDIGIYDGQRSQFVPVPDSDDLLSARPSPMNRYILIRRTDVAVRS